jgi:uncharacterized protein
MKYSEQIVTFVCDGSELFGIVGVPEVPATTGVVVIVGGPQYRVGSHRQFLLLSRALAVAGYASIRFDYRGMGDSTASQRTFEAVSRDIKAAIDALQIHHPSLKKLVLWGLCDGASAALLYCQEMRDPRIKALCLLNPWVRSESSLAKVQVKHYYLQRLKQKEFWVKFFQGGVAGKAFTEFLQKLRLFKNHAQARFDSEALAPFQDRMALAWNEFDGHLMLILSGEDYTAKEFIEHAATNDGWKSYDKRPYLQVCHVPGVDHTFSNRASREIAASLTVQCLNALTNST